MNIQLQVENALPPMHNLLLAALSEPSRVQLAAHMTSEVVLLGSILCEPGEVFQKVYFPDDCLISELALTPQHLSLEIALIGSEGMLGCAVGLGQDVAHVRAVVQRAGTVSCISSSDFFTEFKRNNELRVLLHRYTDGMLEQVTQIALCSHYHLLEARLARSLLTIRDRLQSNTFHLTHEIMAHALGVRRVGVTKAASALQTQNLISYSRGNIKIINPSGLSLASCSCYLAMKDSAQQVFSPTKSEIS